MANKISVIIDVAVDKGVTSLKKFRTAIAEADSASGKMKAGFGVARDSIVANSANIAMAAGGALVAFGVKSVKAFQDTALAAGQFADATGASVESASRWIEVAGDFGIEAGAVEGAMRKMNLAIANGKPVMDDFGDAIVRTKDGTVDSAATFENLITRIGAIKDPTERAKAAQEAFGKSYGDVARFMEMSATDLAAALGNVSEQKVIDQAELEKARRFQASMDELKDKLDDVTMAVGEAIVPVLSDMADQVGMVSDAIDTLTGAEGGGGIGRLVGVLNRAVDGIGNAGDALNWFTEKLTGAENFTGRLWAGLKALVGAGDESTVTIEAGTDAAAEMARIYGERVVPAVDSATTYIEDLEESTVALDDTYSAFLGKLDQQDAWDNFFEKMYVYHSETGRSEQETRDYARAIGEMVIALEGVPPETKAQMIATLDAGNIAAIESRLNQLARNRVVSIGGQLVGGNMRNQIEGRGATGGIVNRPTVALIGEAGPEAVIPLNRTRGNSPLPGGMGGSISVAIYPKTLPTDRELIDLVTNLRRRNGNVI